VSSCAFSVVIPSTVDASRSGRAVRGLSSKVLRKRCANRVGAVVAVFAQAEGKYNPAYPASDRSASLTPAIWLSFSLHEIVHVFLRSCAGRDGPSTASARSAYGDWRDSRGSHRASASGAVPTRGRSCSGPSVPTTWALDFQFDETADQRRLKLLNVVDEHTREALAMRVGRSCDADQVVAMIESSSPARERPSTCAWTTVPSSWPGRCGLVPARRNGHDLHRTQLAMENPFIESFNGRVRDELLNVEEFASLLAAQVVPRRHDPRRVCQAVDHQPASALVAAGPVNEVPSVGTVI
jgi:hypothetical protein